MAVAKLPWEASRLAYWLIFSASRMPIAAGPERWVCSTARRSTTTFSTRSWGTEAQYMSTTTSLIKYVNGHFEKYWLIANYKQFIIHKLPVYLTSNFIYFNLASCLGRAFYFCLQKTVSLAAKHFTVFTSQLLLVSVLFGAGMVAYSFVLEWKCRDTAGLGEDFPQNFFAMTYHLSHY